MDKTGNPLPWMNYCVIDFLRDRLTAESRVFEFGGGQSTLFFSSLALSVTTVERDPVYHEVLNNQIPSNVRLLHRPEEEDYVSSLTTCKDQFDLILVDGHYRERCLLLAAEKLTERGIIVLDDCDRKEYSLAIRDLRLRGFRSLRLNGLGPCVFRSKCALVFYRSTL